MIRSRISILTFTLLLWTGSLGSLMGQQASRPQQAGAVKARRSSGKKAGTDQGSSSPASPGDSPAKMSLLRDLVFDAPVILVHSVAFSPDSKTIAGIADVGSLLKRDGSRTVIRLWDVGTGRVKRTLWELENSVGEYTLSFSPDGKTLATGEESTVKLWDAQTGQVKRILEIPLNPDNVMTIKLLSVAFSPDSNLIVGLAPEVICLWNAQTGELIWRHDVPPPEKDENQQYWESAAFSPDGQTIAVGGGIGDSRISFYEMKTGATLDVWKSGVGNLTTIAYSPDGRMLVAGGGVDGSVSGNLEVWDLVSRKVKVAVSLDVVTSYFWSLALSPDGKIIVTASDDKVRLWDSQTGKLKLTFPSSGIGIQSVAYSPDGKMIVVKNSKRIRLLIAHN